MGNFTKWLGAGLGFTLGGPIGSIIGFAVGSFVDGFSKEDILKKFVFARCDFGVYAEETLGYVGAKIKLLYQNTYSNEKRL